MKKFLTVICAAAIFLTGCSNEPPVEVHTEKVLSVGDALTITHEGKISPSNEIKIFSPTSGKILEKYFEDGSDVTEGQKLFKIGDAEKELELSQTKAALAESMTALAKALVEKDSKAAELQLEVEENQARVKKLEEETSGGTIYAPKAGSLGAIFSPIGMNVIENETVLATIGNINPVVVELEISDAEYKILTAADNLKISLKFADGMTYQHAGTLRILNNKTAEAIFENRDEILIFGTDAQINIDGAKIENALLVPEVAIQQSGAENFVYINKNGEAAVKKIQRGDKIGNHYVVNDGLTADDSVVVDGFKILREGSPLKVNDK